MDFPEIVPIYFMFLQMISYDAVETVLAISVLQYTYSTNFT